MTDTVPDENSDVQETSTTDSPGTDAPPFHEPSQEYREIVERAVKAGLDNKVIAELIGISQKQLANCYPLELESGGQRIMEVVDALYQRAVDGNVPAIKFYLECRAGWIAKEKEQEIASKANPLEIKFYTPPPAPPEPLTPLDDIDSENTSSDTSTDTT